MVSACAETFAAELVGRINVIKTVVEKSPEKDRL